MSASKTFTIQQLKQAISKAPELRSDHEARDIILLLIEETQGLKREVLIKLGSGRHDNLGLQTTDALFKMQQGKSAINLSTLEQNLGITLRFCNDENLGGFAVWILLGNVNESPGIVQKMQSRAIHVIERDEALQKIANAEASTALAVTTSGEAFTPAGMA